jgi:alanine racemase
MPAGLPACAVVDLDAVRDNVAALCRRVAPAGVMAVVKADAYGHGLIPCARAALAGGASWLGVAQLGEALALRGAGITAPMLSWLTVPGDAYAAAVAADVELGVSAEWALREIAAAARALGRTARVQLKVDTGLGRNGVSPAQWPGVVRAALAVQAEGAIELTGAFSHYAWADDPQHPTVRAQTVAFAQAVQDAERLGARFRWRHLANSAATLTNPDARFDLVRPGLAVYGLSPVPNLADPAGFGLRPAMALAGRVALVKRVPAGHGVSYGHEYTTPAETALALIPLGYADGLPRLAGNAGPLLLGGRRLQIAGRVCMDQVVVDLADPDGCGVVEGDVAVLFGPGEDGEPTAEDWARCARTISYEIVSRVGARVPRYHVGSGTGAAASGAAVSGATVSAAGPAVAVPSVPAP